MYNICNNIFINIIEKIKFLNRDIFTHFHIQVLLFRYFTDLFIFQFFENL